MSPLTRRMPTRDPVRVTASPDRSLGTTIEAAGMAEPTATSNCSARTSQWVVEPMVAVLSRPPTQLMVRYASTVVVSAVAAAARGAPIRANSSACGAGWLDWVVLLGSIALNCDQSMVLGRASSAPNPMVNEMMYQL